MADEMNKSTQELGDEELDKVTGGSSENVSAIMPRPNRRSFHSDEAFEQALARWKKETASRLRAR